MRVTTTILALLLSATSFSQNISPINADGKIEYTEVVQADSAKAQQLYSKAKQFIANAFVSSKDATQLTDDNAQSIVMKFVLRETVNAGLGFKYPITVHATMNLQTKDGRYKYSFSQFNWEYKPGTATPNYTGDLEEVDPKGLSKKQIASVREQVDADVKVFVEKLKKSMAGSTKADW